MGKITGGRFKLLPHRLFFCCLINSSLYNGNSAVGEIALTPRPFPRIIGDRNMHMENQRPSEQKGLWNLEKEEQKDDSIGM